MSDKIRPVRAGESVTGQFREDVRSSPGCAIAAGLGVVLIGATLAAIPTAFEKAQDVYHAVDENQFTVGVLLAGSGYFALRSEKLTKKRGITLAGAGALVAGSALMLSDVASGSDDDEPSATTTTVVEQPVAPDDEFEAVDQKGDTIEITIPAGFPCHDTPTYLVDSEPGIDTVHEIVMAQQGYSEQQMAELYAAEPAIKDLSTVDRGQPVDINCLP